MTDTRPRIAPLPPEQWTDEIQDIFQIMGAPGSPVKGSDFNSLLVMVNHPPVTRRWLEFSRELGGSALIDARLKEIATLRVAWLLKSRYEWVHHLVAGQRLGLGPDHVAAVQAGSADPVWSDVERHVIDLADQFCARRSVTPQTDAGLRAHFDDAQRLELYYLVGSYVALALIFNSADVQPEPMFMEMVAANGWPMPGED